MTAANNAFRMEQGAGWTRGLPNLLSAELRHWFRTRKWWSQILIWALLVNLSVFGMTKQGMKNATELLLQFGTLMGIMAPIGACILLQGAVIDEKKSGTAAWVLSKPASRRAFLVAKALANMLGIATTMVLAQGLIVYRIVLGASGRAMPPLAFLAGLGVHVANLWFYVALVLMLGTIFEQRGAVIGIGMASLFVQGMLIMRMPELGRILPVALAVPLSNAPPLATALLTGGKPASYLPLAFTLAVAVLFSAIAVWAFEQSEL